MSFEIAGKLHKIFETEQKTNTFQAREFVIEINDGGYSNFIKFQLTQDRCSLIDEYQENEPIKVFFDLRGREWQGKYFTNLNAWRLAKPEEAQAPDPGMASTDDPFPAASDEPPAADDDLPF